MSAPRKVELLGVPYSPWSEKAKWALEARQIPYTFRLYAPLLGEPALRRKLGKWSGPVSVPVLTDEDGRAIPDSAAIARWADGRGRGPAMFPLGQEAAVERFVELSERGLAAGRAVSLRRVLEDPDAVRELVPRKLRKLPRLAAWVGRVGVRRTMRKYGAHRADTATHLGVLTGVLDELRAALAAAPDGTPRTLLGRLSFADLAMAQVLVYVQPPASGLRLGAASRRRFADPALAERYADLVAWRDALYTAHRDIG